MRLNAARNSKLDDPSSAVPYIGPAMLDEAQGLYIDEVLGITHFAAGLNPPPEAAIVDVVVMTTELSSEQEFLFKKIMASIKLQAFTHIEVNEVRLGCLPDEIRARHIIAFNDEHNGRSTSEDSVWWSLPSLTSMIGENADVASNKKEAWTFLQQFAREFLS